MAIDAVIGLLKEVIEQGDVDDGVRNKLEDAVQRLCEVREAGPSERDQRNTALFWLGKALEALPELAKLANKLLGGE